MNVLHRCALMTATLLLAGSACAQIKTGDNPEASVIWQKVRASLFDKRPISTAAEGVITLETPVRAEDAAVVPVAVRAKFPQTPGRWIDKVWLVIDNNPSPVSAVFQFTPNSGRADIETRVRVDEYSHVRAIAEMNDGSLVMAVRWVKASGGCSAPPGKDAQAALATLGRMKFRVEDAGLPGQPVLAQLMISHPNNSGLAMDQYTRQFTPAHYVRKVNVTYAGKPVLSADVDFSISENPNFRFYFQPTGPGELKAEIEDTRELRFVSRLGLPARTLMRLAACLGVAAALATGGAAAAPFAYITNQGSHDVSVIDLATQRVVATVPVGHSPAGVVASSAAGRVYVSNPDSKTVSVIDMKSQAVVATLPAGQGPVGIDAAADGSVLLVADWYAQQLLVYTLRGSEGGAPAAIPVGRAPAGVAADARHPALAYVAERDDDSVAVVDLLAGRVLARVRVGSHPFALLHDAARQRLYALNVQSDDVTVVDTRDPGAPVVLATVKVGKAPYGAALADGGRLLYVTNQHADSVSVVDAQTLAVVRTLPGFAYPEGVAAHGDRVYVVNWMDDNVSVLDAASGRTLHTIATGKNSRGFGAFIGAPAAP